MKTITGRVVSTKMKKTIVVEADRQMTHHLYQKILRRTTRYKAHCEDTGIREGDVVKIVSVRPISKDKYFRFLEKVNN